MSETWPPDWRAARADAADAMVIALGVVLVELEELEALAEAHDSIPAMARTLAGSVRAWRSDLRSEAETLRVAIDARAVA